MRNVDCSYNRKVLSNKNVTQLIRTVLHNEYLFCRLSFRTITIKILKNAGFSSKLMMLKWNLITEFMNDSLLLPTYKKYKYNERSSSTEHF